MLKAVKVLLDKVEQDAVCYDTGFYAAELQNFRDEWATPPTILQLASTMLAMCGADLLQKNSINSNPGGIDDMIHNLFDMGVTNFGASKSDLPPKLVEKLEAASAEAKSLLMPAPSTPRSASQKRKVPVTPVPSPEGQNPATQNPDE